MGNFVRNYATPLSVVTFAAVGVTGLFMLVGIRNHGLGELHEKLGLLFVIAAALHLIKNRKGLANVLAQTRGKIVVGVLGALAILAVGSAFLTGNDDFGGPERRGPGGPNAALEMRLSYAPINTLAPAMGLSSSQVISRLRKGGVNVAGPGQNLADIAQKQGTDVGRLLFLIVNDPPPNSAH